MANKNISDSTLYGAIKTWDSNFVGGQTWTRTIDYSGGHCWTCAGGYDPYVDTTNGLIKWQSYNTFYSSGYKIAHFTEPTSIITPGVVDGTIYGYMLTGNHTQSTSYNFFCTSADYAGDNTYYDHIRNTNGLSITVASYGNYYGAYTQAKAYCDNVLLGTIGVISSLSTYYTIKFRLLGNNLYAFIGAGDLRSTSPTMVLLSSSVPYVNLTGRDTMVYMSSWITNDQGPYSYGQVNSVSLRNYN